MINYELILWSSISALVWVNVLTQADGIFGFLKSLFTSAPKFINHVLFVCANCNSAWWAMAYYVLFNGLDWLIVPFVLVAIFTTHFIGKVFVNYLR